MEPTAISSADRPGLITPIFEPEEREENEAKKAALFELILSGKALLLVGAGSSVPAKYVTWDKLLEKLEQLAHACGSSFTPDAQLRHDDPLGYADLIRSHIERHTGSRDQYVSLLYELFAPQGRLCADMHRQLVALPFRGILTTNYDGVLETALAEVRPAPDDNFFIVKKDMAIQVAEFVHSFDDDAVPRRVAHLHGRFNVANEIILGYADYLKAYGYKVKGEKMQPTRIEWTLHRKLLWAVLAMQRMVFVGYSMSDPYFKVMLQSVTNDLWIWNRPRHYAIMGIAAEDAQRTKMWAKDLQRRCSVSVVFYENIDGSHLGLQQIIAEAAMKCGVRPRTATGFARWLDLANARLGDEP